MPDLRVSRGLGHAYHGGTRVVRRRIDQRVCKIDIKRHQGPPFATVDLDQVPIIRRRQRLGWRRAHIMVYNGQEPLPAFAKILVGSNLPDASSGMSTNRSRAISEPYARQARMSSSSSPG